MKYQSIYNRIKRIEGQVRGVSEMLASDKPEQDILIQIEAARSSLGSTITSFIELQLSIESDGKIELNKEQLRAILRSVKR
jgi:DNA-binding FrmR family transcriptional regulator